MSYVGNTPTQQAFSPAIDYFSGNGSTVAFTLSRPVASVAQVQVTVNNVAQNPSTAFTVSSNTITFTGAPSSGTNNIYVQYTSPITQVIQPGQGTVGTTQLTDGSVTPTKLSTGAPTWTSGGALSVTGAIGSSSTVTGGVGVIGQTTISGAFGLRAVADSTDTYAGIQFTNYAQNTAWSYIRSYGSYKLSILDGAGSSSVNVGIGTTTPDASYSLDTTGTIRSRSDVYAGFVNGTSGGVWLARSAYSQPAVQSVTSAGNAGQLYLNPAGGYIILGTNGGGVRQINLNSNEIAIAQATTTNYLNFSDASGSNGSTYSWNVRGLASSGTAQANLAAVYFYTASLGTNGALSKGSGSFRIDHPLPSMEATHQLVHSFIEGPRIDLIYRGEATLVNGTAVVNIDQEATMTEGTFEALCREAQCFTTNETDWDAVKGSVSGNLLTITCQNSASTAKISWMVIAERKDKHIMDTNWTDSNGKVIVEPLKPEPVEGDLPHAGG